MNLTNRITTDLKTAMKARDKAAIRGIRAIKNAILLAQTDGSGEELTPEREIQLVQKLIKQRKDSLAIYEEQGREDLAQIEREEITTIEQYLPPQLSEDELRQALTTIVEEIGAESMRDMGKVMSLAQQRLAGRADGKTISQVVRQLLS